MTTWTTDELVLAFYWYCTKISFTKIRYTKPEVIELAELVGRTPSAAAFKLVNFARLDPALQQRGIKGMRGGSKAEIPIWNQYYNNWEELAYTAEKIIAAKKQTNIEQVSGIQTIDLPPAGKERDAIVKLRVNQKFFRKTVLLSYEGTCCITGIRIRELLVASHIKPWAVDLSQGANPRNGLCLNALHDKAFDKGLITISDDFTIVVSSRILNQKKEALVNNFFLPYHGTQIIKPTRFMPDQNFLQYHRDKVFIK